LIRNFDHTLLPNARAQHDMGMGAGELEGVLQRVRQLSQQPLTVCGASLPS